jgi:hypothetical protein
MGTSAMRCWRRVTSMMRSASAKAASMSPKVAA